jgi:phage tail tape-measure protein
LNAALGPDVDIPEVKKGEGAAVAATAASEVVKSILPGLGLVRVITGADKQQRRVEAAVYGGSVRRGFLKGLGASKGCKPPAAPPDVAQSLTPELTPAEKD